MADDRELVMEDGTRLFTGTHHGKSDICNCHQNFGDFTSESGPKSSMLTSDPIHKSSR